jgi:hypothetical protein
VAGRAGDEYTHDVFLMMSEPDIRR